MEMHFVPNTMLAAVAGGCALQPAAVNCTCRFMHALPQTPFNRIKQKHLHNLFCHCYIFASIEGGAFKALMLLQAVDR